MIAATSPGVKSPPRTPPDSWGGPSSAVRLSECAIRIAKQEETKVGLVPSFSPRQPKGVSRRVSEKTQKYKVQEAQRKVDLLLGYRRAAREFRKDHREEGAMVREINSISAEKLKIDFGQIPINTKLGWDSLKKDTDEGITNSFR